jgi:hypothetical protein
MSDLTARLGLPLLAPSQAQKHVTHNEALQRLDGMVQLVLASIGGQNPPLLPVAGEVHALGLTPTGDWSGQGGQLAQWQFGQWQFIAPQTGWRAWDQTDGVMRMYQSGDWGAQLQNIAGLGIGTLSDAQNLLAVASAASLFSHAGADHQMKINKAGASNSATLMFQSAWDGHAEMGLAGDTNFHIKTSADGSNWTEALVIDAATGLFTGAGVQAAATDATAGLVMKVGAFGWGDGAIRVTRGAEIADCNTIAVAGLYPFDATTTNAPGGTNFGMIQHLPRFAAVEQVQLAWAVNGNRRWWRRRGADGIWTPWYLDYGSSTILGTVSQSGGVPTGAIIERGSNANGEYVRFADGTQMCHRFALPSVFNGNAAWTFPAAFIAAPTISVNAAYSGGMRAANSHTTTATVTQVRTSDMSGVETFTPVVDALAMGRWF